MTAPVLFVAVFMVEGSLRPDYHPFSMFVSELSLGPRGWVQIINFLISRALLVVFGHGVAPYLRGDSPAPPARSSCRSSVSAS